MQCSENKVTGGRGGEGELDRFQVTHFADEQDVWVFTEGAAQTRSERACMHPDFAMIDETILAAMDKLDWIFDRNDVVLALKIRVIHHRGQGGRFTGTGRAGRENQTLLQQRKLFQDRRHVELFQRLDIRRDRAEHRRDAVFLLEKIRAITSDARHFVTKIDIVCFLENLDLYLWRDLVNHGLEVVILQRRIIHANELAVDAEHRRVVGREMQVGSLLLGHQLEERVNARHRSFPLEKLN